MLSEFSVNSNALVLLVEYTSATAQHLAGFIVEVAILQLVRFSG